MIFSSGSKRGPREGGIGQTSFTTARTVSPGAQTQVVARSLLRDGPYTVIELGGDPAAKISFPASGGAVTIPNVPASRAFYQSNGWNKTVEKIRKTQNTKLVTMTGGFFGSRKFPEGTMYRTIQKLWAPVWFTESDGIPIYRFEVTGTFNEQGRAHVEQWVIALAPEDPEKTGRQAFKFIMRRHREGFLARLWDLLEEVPHAFVAAAEGLIDAIKDLACGAARPYLDELALLAVLGPSAFGAQRLATLSKKTGIPESDLKKVSNDPAGDVVEGLTNVIMDRVCGGGIVLEPGPVPPPSPAIFPPGSVAVFDTTIGQYRILAPPF